MAHKRLLGREIHVKQLDQGNDPLAKQKKTYCFPDVERNYTLQDWLRPVVEGRRVYLGNLPSRANQIRSFGAITAEVNHLLSKDRCVLSNFNVGRTQSSAGFMLADFETQFGAEATVESLQCHMLFRRKLSVRLDLIDSVKPTGAEQDDIPPAIAGGLLSLAELAYIKNRTRESTYTRPPKGLWKHLGDGLHERLRATVIHTTYRGQRATYMAGYALKKCAYSHSSKQGIYTTTDAESETGGLRC
jgi:hypothetical protein